MKKQFVHTPQEGDLVVIDEKYEFAHLFIKDYSIYGFSALETYIFRKNGIGIILSNIWQHPSAIPTVTMLFCGYIVSCRMSCVRVIATDYDQ